MAQARKTFFSLGGPTYIDDPRVNEAQRWQQLQQAQQAQAQQAQAQQRAMTNAAADRQMRWALAQQEGTLARERLAQQDRQFGAQQAGQVSRGKARRAHELSLQEILTGRQESQQERQQGFQTERDRLQNERRVAAESRKAERDAALQEATNKRDAKRIKDKYKHEEDLAKDAWDRQKLLLDRQEKERTKRQLKEDALRARDDVQRGLDRTESAKRYNREFLLKERKAKGQEDLLRREIEREEEREEREEQANWSNTRGTIQENISRIEGLDTDEQSKEAGMLLRQLEAELAGGKNSKGYRFALERLKEAEQRRPGSTLGSWLVGGGTSWFNPFSLGLPGKGIRELWSGAGGPSVPDEYNPFEFGMDQRRKWQRQMEQSEIDRLARDYPMIPK